VKNVAVVSAKGGVGKTTISANLGAYFTRVGRRVLMVDLDPQNALRLHAGAQHADVQGLSQATMLQRSWQDAVLSGTAGMTRMKGMDVLPHGSIPETDRPRFDRTLDEYPDLVATSLASIRMPDDAIVVLDTPPGPSVYLRQALRAADLVLVVILPDAASYATLPSMATLVDTYGKHGAQTPLGFIVNQIDVARQLTKDVLQVMRQDLGERLIGLVHEDEAVREALASAMSVLDYDANSRAARDIAECGQRVLRRLQASVDSYA
jgi:cellulose synthase operon protein YhjQ